jgi:putative transposase
MAVDPNHKDLSLFRQCKLLGLSRSSYYFESAEETAYNLGLMNLIDLEYTAHPFYGSRRMTAWLNVSGYFVNRKRILSWLAKTGQKN